MGTVGSIVAANFELITGVSGASAASQSEQPDSAGSSNSGHGEVGPTPGNVETAQQQVVERPVSWTEVQIKTRDEALVALEKVSSYFEIHEPSHPAPFLIRRVQQTIPLNFHEMLKNLTPGNAEQFENWLPREE